ncbi:hypothetical protein [Actinomadura opuntiae]|uniref:hypothetical protein n=1 Tax=Actinomadura sp. OS1-43 TaxID=604315 RepID=UPI00255AC1C4|nr:hypothetical protein [Actinomadura sp. OS1-43]MDL4818625.1 hypothetical protein [Actinomadura sp. OS1-43]
MDKFGAIESMQWATGTARLLKGRTTRPVFLADRQVPASGRRVPAAGNVCPVTGRGRPSYPRAEYLFQDRLGRLGLAR